jgi:hypothetical protein
MADTIEDVAAHLAKFAEHLGIEWEGYGRPGRDEYRVALDSTIDYLKKLDGDVSIELPSSGLKVDKLESGGYHVYIKAGAIGDFDD